MSEKIKNFKNLPKHVAIIPDGNRRWAKNQSKASSFGHKKGIETFEAIVNRAFDLEIPNLTAWGCSTSNLQNRGSEEVIFLYQLFKKTFKKLLDNEKIFKNKIRVRVLGKWREKFPKPLIYVIEKLINKTSSYSKGNLTYLMAYDGRDEMIEAISKLKQNGHQLINADLVKKNLWTHDLPPVDLVIRTGGEPHWSAGFMMWDTAESQLYFTEKCWPEFGIEEFDRALASYSQRERRMGK